MLTGWGWGVAGRGTLPAQGVPLQGSAQTQLRMPPSLLYFSHKGERHCSDFFRLAEQVLMQLSRRSEVA